MTSIERYRNNDPPSQEELFQIQKRYLETVAPDAGAEAGTANAAFLRAFALTLANYQEQALTQVYNASFIESATGNDLTRKARELGFVRREGVASTGVVSFERDSPAAQNYIIPAGVEVSTGGVDPTLFEVLEPVTLQSGQTSVLADVVCTTTGTDGNVAAGAIDTIPTSIEGIDSVQNPSAIGDPTSTLTDGVTPLTQGQDRETDAQLRRRVLNEDGTPPSASSQDIATAVASLPDVVDSTAIVNNTQTDNTGSGGLPPFSTELVVQGGNTDDVVRTLFETMSHIDFRRLAAGIHGTEVTSTVTDPLTDEVLTGRFSRPTIVAPSITIDLVVIENQFAGRAASKANVIDYIGGQTPSSGQVVGLTLGEDIYVDRIDTAVTTTSGVRGATSITIDNTGDGTDDTQTDANGLASLSIADTEVAFVEPTDITINTTTV